MKIAVAVTDNMVSGHFGHCEGLSIFEIKNGQIIKIENYKNNGDCHTIPVFLKNKGVEVLLAGGIGAGAISRCNENGVSVISGVTGGIKESVLSYLNNTLNASGEVCNHHDDNCHSGTCHNH